MRIRLDKKCDQRPVSTITLLTESPHVPGVRPEIFRPAQASAEMLDEVLLSRASRRIADFEMRRRRASVSNSAFSFSEILQVMLVIEDKGNTLCCFVQYAPELILPEHSSLDWWI
jgi:hypothetical protein